MNKKTKKFLETKRKEYCEWVEKNPYPMDNGIEMKECEGCYCQMFHNSGYDFCSGCLGCESMDCLWGCCDCYSDGSRGWRSSDGKIKKGKFRDKIKQLSFPQKQRLYWEQMKMRIEDMIEKIKDHEDADDMLIAKRIEDAKRWVGQEKERIVKDLTEKELKKLLERFQKTKLKGNEK